jgi:hypothetical protein
MKQGMVVFGAEIVYKEMMEIERVEMVLSFN